MKLTQLNERKINLFTFFNKHFAMRTILPLSVSRDIEIIAKYLRVVNAEFIAKQIFGIVKKGLVTYRDPEHNWYHVTFSPQISFKTAKESLPIVNDSYLQDFLEAYSEEYRAPFLGDDEALLLKQKEIDWKSMILSDYSREEHIKRLIWNLADSNKESLRSTIENVAQLILSPDNVINFNEFHAEGMCFEIVNHNSSRKTSADLRDVRLKAMDGLFGGYPYYGKRKPCLPNSSFLRIPHEIYKSGIGGCKIVEIGAGVFDYMTDVEVLELPNTLRRVERSLWECRKLKEIRIFNSYDLKGFKTINGVLYSGDLKTLIAYPNRHGDEYEVPEGVEKIANKAFKDCIGLKKLVLPKTLKSIGINAFYRCEGLKLIIVNNQEGSIKYEGLFGDYGCVNPIWQYIS